jgi:hypothetical protein
MGAWQGDKGRMVKEKNGKGCHGEVDGWMKGHIDMGDSQ